MSNSGHSFIFNLKLNITKAGQDSRSASTEHVQKTAQCELNVHVTYDVM